MPRMAFACAWPGVLSTAATFAQAPPGYDLDFVTVGAPGNRATIPGEVPAMPWLEIGAVDHRYRIMRTHVSVAQYLEFVNAYAPFWQGDPLNPDLFGFWGQPVQGPGGKWTYVPRLGSSDFAARVRWDMAARYCNWLHNGKANVAAAFESGVYDSSTFKHGPGWWSHQVEPSEGALFWMPSLDEFTKAAYYDPDRYGLGQEGYWQYPDASDEPLTKGLPRQGGETIGDLLGERNPNFGLGAWPLGMYPHVQSPWGLIDVSATVRDYTSTTGQLYGYASVAGGGSMSGHPIYAYDDRIDMNPGEPIIASWGGIRLASVVPSPSLVVFALIASGMTLSRTRRRSQ